MLLVTTDVFFRDQSSGYRGQSSIEDLQIPVRKVMPWPEGMSRKVVGS